MGFFTVEHYIQGITMALGAVIIGAIVFPVTVEAIFAHTLSPTMAYVGWAFACPLFSGFSTIMFPILILGYILGFANYYIVLYITYAVTGPDFAPSTEKAVTMVIVSTVIVALLHILRVRVQVMAGPAAIAQILPNVFLYILYWDPKPPHVQSHWQFIVVFFIPAVLGVVLSFFIIPNPAGKRARQLLGQLLSITGALQSEVTQKLLAADVDENSGKIIVAAKENSSGSSAAVSSTAASVPAVSTENVARLEEGSKEQKEGRYVAIAAELEPLVLPIHKLDIQAWQIAVGLNGLLLLSGLEVDVYSKPHIFPKKAFSAVLAPIRAVEHLFLTIATFVETGLAPMKGFRLLKNEIEEVRVAVNTSCSKMKEVIVDDAKYETALMESVPSVEAACAALKKKMEENELRGGGGGGSDGENGGDATGVNADDLLVARELISMVLLASKELRTAWENVPALIAVRQPEAGPVAEAYFTANTSTLGQFENNIGSTGDSTIKKQSSSVPSPQASPASPEQPRPAFREVVRLTPSCSALRIKLYNLSLKTGIHAWHFKLTLHMTCVFLVAAILCVNSTANDALGKHAYWIIINIFATTENTSTSMRDSAWQRIVGTAIGAVGVCGLAGLGYLANGSSYVGHNTACRIFQTAFVAIWMGIANLFHAKYAPRLHRLFIIITFMPPLIAIMDSDGSDVWPNIGWRLANTCIGVGLHTFFSFVLFPVSAEDHLKEQTSDCVLHIAQMLEQVSALPLDAPPAASSLDSSSSASKKSGGGGCLGGLRKRKGNSVTSSTKNGSVQEEGDLEAAAAAAKGVQAGQVSAPSVMNEDSTSLAAKAIISAGIQNADKSLVQVMQERDVVAKEYFVTKLQYDCFNGSGRVSRDDITLPLDREQLDYNEDKPVGGLNKCLNLRAPLHLYHLDQLISHLKHNIVYSNIALSVREWLRSQNVFAKRPEMGLATKAFAEQTAECFKALRLAILQLVTPEEAVQTVLNLRKMATDICILCNSSENFGSDEATIIHVLLMSCRNIEYLFRATDRALVTRDQPGVISVTDRELQGGVTMLSLLNLQATANVVQAVKTEDEVRKGGVATARDGVRELVGITRVI
jgi:hypothetical protein